MAAQLRASSYVRYGLPVRQPADEAHVRTCVCLVGRGEAGMSAVCRLRVWACAEYVLPHRWRAALHDPCSGCNATVCLSVFPSAALPVVPRCLLRQAMAETAEYKPEAIQRPSLQWNVFLLVHGDHTLVVHAKSSDRALHHCIHRLTLDKIVESLSTKG